MVAITNVKFKSIDLTKIQPDQESYPKSFCLIQWTNLSNLKYNGDIYMIELAIAQFIQFICILLNILEIYVLLFYTIIGVIIINTIIIRYWINSIKKI